ncbi:hypothetical protein [Arcobacter sp. L]|uniref:hypothetical protein n=1 Tax=Arcobacter sp. L TaxID=944547 RepID=UPI000229646E|nr:hypothetical protein [Arcobacter sp. L]BAK73718.1 hypothetical protein ABLL_1843 [Arcobacter sp. L]
MAFIPFVLFIVVWIFTYKHFISKQKGKFISHFLGFIISFLVFIISLTIIAPTSTPTLEQIEKKEEPKISDTSNTQLKVLKVSDYPYTFKNKSAVSFYIGTDEYNYINITIPRENVKKGFILNTKLNTNDRNLISAIASWDKKTYFDNENSFVIFEITDIDYKNKTASIKLEVSLNEAKEIASNFHVQLTANITDEVFNNFIKKDEIKDKYLNKKLENKPLIDLKAYQSISPEYVFANFINKWGDKNYKEMAEYTQLRWKEKEKNPEEFLRNLYDLKNLQSAEIVKIEKSGTAAYKIIANMIYINTMNNEEYNVSITGMVIKEENIWGVNPISTLAEK